MPYAISYYISHNCVLMVNRNPERTLKWITLKTWFRSKLKCKRNNRKWHRDVNCAVQELNSFWLNPCPQPSAHSPQLTAHIPVATNIYFNFKWCAYITYARVWLDKHIFAISKFAITKCTPRCESMSPLNFQKSFITLSSFSRPRIQMNRHIEMLFI